LSQTKSASRVSNSDLYNGQEFTLKTFNIQGYLAAKKRSSLQWEIKKAPDKPGA